MTRALALIFLLSVAACSDPSVTGNDVNPPADGFDNGSSADVTNEAQSNGAMPPFAEVPGAHPTAPEPAPIPAKFRGTWAENKAACADLANHTRLTISGRAVRHPDFVIFGDSVTIPATDQFALKGKIEATGAPAEAHYSINAANDVLTDGAGGGYVRVRCG